MLFPKAYTWRFRAAVISRAYRRTAKDLETKRVPATRSVFQHADKHAPSLWPVTGYWIRITDPSALTKEPIRRTTSASPDGSSGTTALTWQSPFPTIPIKLLSAGLPPMVTLDASETGAAPTMMLSDASGGFVGPQPVPNN